MAMVTTAVPPSTTQRPEPEVEGSGPIARVVAGSVAVGLVGALLLTLVVFAGAKEHVISGVALLAFALGWAMLGVLSTRLTIQPQRWTFFVAAHMAAAGAYF